MKLLRAALLVFACAASSLAFAQWQWVDKDGRKVFSDQPPPPGTPPEKILKRPGNAKVPDAELLAAPTPPAPAAPKVSGKDTELEAKRKAASAAEADKKRAQEDQVAREKAENCDRAKRAKATIDSGVRLSIVNDKGEREIMDDNARAAEGKRLDAVISASCKA
jgi:hypothetical protein